MNADEERHVVAEGIERTDPVGRGSELRMVCAGTNASAGGGEVRDQVGPRNESGALGNHAIALSDAPTPARELRWSRGSASIEPEERSY